LGDIGADWKILLKWTFKKYAARALIGFVWIRVVTNGGLL
jgi:hypothetical protein